MKVGGGVGSAYQCTLVQIAQRVQHMMKPHLSRESAFGGFVLCCLDVHCLSFHFRVTA